MIDVLADECDEAVADTSVKDFSIGEVIGEVIDALTDDVLMNVLAAAMVDGVDMWDSDLTILVVEAMVASGFVVPVSCPVDVLAGDWAASVMKSFGGVRIEAVVETLAAVIIIRVVGVLVDVDANVLSANTTALGFITVSA